MLSCFVQKVFNILYIAIWCLNMYIDIGEIEELKSVRLDNEGIQDERKRSRMNCVSDLHDTVDGSSI